MALEDALARVPGLAGYLGQEQFTQRANTATLANANQAATLQDHMLKVQRERGLREALAGLGPNATEDDTMRAITPFAGADTMFRAIEARRAREATMAQTRLLKERDMADKMERFNRELDVLKLPREKRVAAQQEYLNRLRGANAEYTLPADILNKYMGGAAPQQGLPAYADALKAMGGGRNAPFTVEVDPTSPQPVQEAAVAPVAQVATPAPAAPVEAPVAAPSEPVVAPAPPNNMDARDLGAHYRSPTAQGAPVARGETPPSTAPKQPTLADAPKEFSRKDKIKWLQNQLKPGIAGGGTLSPGALRGVAEQFLAGDNTAVQGYARNATAKIALTNAIWDLAAERGMNGDMVAAKVAEFQGVKAGQRSLGTRGALITIAASEANEMADVVLETSKKYPRSKFVPFNYALNAYERNIGNEEIKNFGAAINTFVNAYARAVNPTGVGTVSDKQHARDLLATVDSPEQVEGVIKVLKREMEIAKRAPGQARSELYRETAERGKAAPKKSAADFFR